MGPRRGWSHNSFSKFALASRGGEQPPSLSRSLHETPSQQILAKAPPLMSGNLHYLRIPKTGSSSLLAMVAWARNHSRVACQRLQTHFHDVLPRHLPPGAASFVVLREPCSRFASSYDYVRRPHAHHVHPVDPVHTFADGVDGALRWASLLLRNQTYRDLWMQHTRVGPALAANQSMSHVIAWQQSAYVASNTRFACLPHMRRNVQGILRQMVPGCSLPEFDIRVNDYTPPIRVRPTLELCTMVGALYPEDTRLWRSHCAGF